jgi:hypothetical protein
MWSGVGALCRFLGDDSRGMIRKSAFGGHIARAVFGTRIASVRCDRHCVLKQKPPLLQGAVGVRDAKLNPGQGCIHSRCAPGFQVLLPRGSQFGRPLTGNSAGPLPNQERLLQFRGSTGPVKVARCRGNSRKGPFAGKVSLATPWLWAYDKPCLVNRLWVPIAVRLICSSNDSRLHGNSEISAVFLDSMHRIRRAGELNRPGTTERVANSGTGE